MKGVGKIIQNNPIQLITWTGHLYQAQTIKFLKYLDSKYKIKHKKSSPSLIPQSLQVSQKGEPSPDRNTQTKEINYNTEPFN